jgi:hypothetical protein
MKYMPGKVKALEVHFSSLFLLVLEAPSLYFGGAQYRYSKTFQCLGR